VSIDVWVPDGDTYFPGYAVQKGPMGLSIAAGNAGQDTSLFGVANDQNGALINVFPGGKSFFNLCHNPRFHANITDGWDCWDYIDEYSGVDTDPTWVTSPPVPFLGDADGCVRMRYPAFVSGFGPTTHVFNLPPIWNSQYTWTSFDWYSTGASTTGFYPSNVMCRVYCYDDDDVLLGLGSFLGSGGNNGNAYVPPTAFGRVITLWETPVGTTKMKGQIDLGLWGKSDTSLPYCLFWVTRVMISNHSPYDAYYDGDSAGWDWLGPEHNAVSSTPWVG